MLPINALLILIALVITMVHAAGKAPLWPAVLIIVLLEMLKIWPMR